MGGGSTQNQRHPVPERVTVHQERVRHYRRFGLFGRELNVNINEPPPSVDACEWVEAAMREIYHLAITDTIEDDFIGVEIFSPNLGNGSVWFSFRLVQDFSIDDLWMLFLSVTQSSTDFNFTDPITVVASRVRPSRGAGRITLTRFDVKKKSILQVKSDNLCLPRSLIASYFYELRGQARSGDYHKLWNSVRQENGKLQKSLALKLSRRVGIEIPRNGCGLNEIYAFQLHFARKGVAIVIYNFTEFGTGQPPMFDGTELVLRTRGNVRFTLRVMFSEAHRHFRPILNCTGAAGSRNFCIPCNQSYTTDRNHNCRKNCIRCFQDNLCDNSQDLIRCQTCDRDFFGQLCYNNHLRQKSYNPRLTVCQGVYVCKMCYKLVRTQRRVHACGEIFCKTCQKYCPINHLCYVQRQPGKLERSAVVYLFYDFETRCEEPLNRGDDNTLVHEPNLCVAHQICTHCLEDENMSNWCQGCGVREYVFTENPVSQFVDLCMLPRKNFSKTICIAHNAKSFDGQFILRHLVEKVRIKPEVILNGTKIILMTVENVKFIDSLNFMNLPLSSLPQAFSLPDIEKGTFPHRFNRRENENYVGPIPALEEYSPEIMKSGDREKFLAWYAEQRDVIFNFQEELIKYCKLDVKILRMACLAYRKIFLNIANICPFEESCTIASTCMKVYRKMFLKPDTIGIIPKNGYRFSNTQSLEAMKWLVWKEHQLQRVIKFAGRGREIRLEEGFLVDGFCDAVDGQLPLVFNYHGCFYHGCIRCFRINRNRPISEKYDECMNDRYERTQRVRKVILDSGKYELVEIWGCDFKQECRNNREMRMYIETHPLLRIKPLNPRDAFYGGRTENFVKVYDARSNEKIRYVDVTSLYPFINKTGRYPVGHPKIFIGDDCYGVLGREYEKIQTFEGLISCKILPPRKLLCPLLPIKMHGKLMFSLCRKCCENMTQGECTHENEAERCLKGTWVADEIKKSVELGYRLIEVYEIWSYETTCYDPATKTGGLFAEYINEFFKLKTEASGYPPGCDVDEEAKDEYIAEFERVEGIRLSKDRISVNPSLRSVAKLCLVSLWGKFGQQEDKTTTEIVQSPVRLNELLFSPTDEVLTILPVNQDVLYVRYRLSADVVKSSFSTVNVVVAAYTTALARLKLYSYLEKLDRSALYVDTDSVIYVSSPGSRELPLGPLLGDLTDELTSYGDGAYIKSFISGGPKFYAYTVIKSDGTQCSVCKIKGIRMNFKNAQTINFDSVRELITNHNDPDEVNENVLHVSNIGIGRTRFHDVVNRAEQKVVRPVYTKRWFVNMLYSLPYGYKSD